MLDTGIRNPYLGWTPRELELADGKTVSVPTTMSLKEFEAFPWPEGQRWELIYGYPVMTPSPLPAHQSLLGTVLVLLKEAADRKDHLKLLPGIDVLLPGSENYLCPDLSILEVTGEYDVSKVPLRTAPVLCVELLSPSTASNDMGAKLNAYAAAGVQEYWVANPATGALSIHTNPVDGEYCEQTADSDGFVVSPFLNQGLRIRRDGLDYTIETRDA